MANKELPGVEEIYKKLKEKSSSKLAKRDVMLVFEAIKEILLKKGECRLIGFGKFIIKTYQPRTIHNFNGGTIEVKERRRLKFQPSSGWKKVL